MAGLVPFDTFRNQVESSKFEDQAEAIERALARKAVGPGGIVPGPGPGPVDLAAEARQEFERMRAYLSEHYRNTSVVHSFVDEGGRIVDCIPFDQQPTVQAVRRKGIDVLRTAPPPLPNNRPVRMEIGPAENPRNRPIVPPLAKGLRDAEGNLRAAPAGTAPVVRITLERLATHGRLDDFFRKGPPVGPWSVVRGPLFAPRTPTPRMNDAAKIPAPADRDSGQQTTDEGLRTKMQSGPDGFIHLHAGVECPPAAPGAYSAVSSFLGVWKPDVSPGSMSLSQQWILSQDPAPDSDYPMTVEGGWQVLGNVGPEPELFVYFNPDGYGPQRGYVNNQNHHGFITFDGALWVPGGSIGDVSSIDGPQVGFVMEWVLDDSGWILYMDGGDGNLNGVGYFPREYYAGGLADGAGFLQFGGEVANADHPSTGQMGSGNPPIDPLDSGYKRVAFQYDLSSRLMGERALSPVDVSGMTLIGEAPENYSAGFRSNGNWGTHFWFGGASWTGS